MTKTETAQIHVAEFAALSPRVLYEIMKLRQDVFVVEQDCPYPDLDGRDTEPATRHLWIERDGRVVSALRIVDDGAGEHRVGRIVTDAAHRSQGLAAALIWQAIKIAGPPLTMGAQAHLTRWYERFGFEVSGAGWDEYGVPHLPMRLERVVD
jgi:ElaA protein